MILLFNVYITNTSATGGVWESQGAGYDRGNLSSYSKLEILKYSLASYAVAYPWSKAIINIQLDTNYNNEPTKTSLRNFVENEFKETKLHFSFTRNIHQKDWIKTYELLDDDLILFQGNHDHVFIDNSQEYFKQLVKLKDEYKENITIPTSHFPEHVRTYQSGYIDFHRGENFPNNPPEHYEVKEDHICVVKENYESLSVISKEIYHNWFVKGNWDQISYPPGTFASGKLELGRTEGAGVVGIGQIKEILKIPNLKQINVIPYKELFRHFDAYAHQNIFNNSCPVLDIPPGFFEGKIKIRYGYDDRKEGWVNINPKNPNYYAHNITGTDYKFTLNDLPLVWKNKISKIDCNPSINEEEMIQHRLQSALEIVYSNPVYDPHIGKDVASKINEFYLKSFPQYQLV